MRTYKNLLIILLGVFLLSACSESGDASFKGGETIITIAVQCVDTPDATDISNYETLQSGDTIVKDNDNTKVTIYHDVNGIKKICLADTNSSAHIVR